MNNKVLSIIFIITIGSNELVSQINQYYKDFNYASEILTANVNNKTIEEADSIFESLFNETDDHHLSDIIYVLNHRSSLGNVQNSFYINTLVKTAKKFKNYKRESNYLLLTRHELNSIKRKLNLNFTYKRKTTSLLRMLLREQRARNKKQDIFQIDSLNAIKIKSMLRDTSLIKHLSYMNKELLELLIFHGGMSCYEQEIDLLRYYIGEKRYLSRDLLSTIIEREAVFGGITYSVINKELTPNAKNELMCEENDGFNLYYSNIGKFKYNINSNQVQVPIDPKLTIEEINKVRGFCYLPNYTKNKDNIYSYPTVKEWCDLVKYY